MSYNYTFKYLQNHCHNFSRIPDEEQLKKFKRQSINKKYVYLIKWSDKKFCWGTMSNSNDRLRKSSIFNIKLTGKYDRRVDYLMLKKIYHNPLIHLFEFTSDGRSYERYLMNYYNQRHCYQGMVGNNRDAISRNIYNNFKATSYYGNLTQADRDLFDEYMRDVFFNPDAWKPISGSTRSWRWGDSLEPNFLGPRLNKQYLEKSIENVLTVRF